MGDKSSSVTVGFKYFLGAHMGLVHGPVDGLQRIRVADKVVWCGTVESGKICIDQPDIFGGDGGEGGVEGIFTFANGEPTQIPSTYLQGQLGEVLPAFRGVSCGILEQMYVSSNNPYLKPWAFYLTRTDVTTRGEEQWYLEKARIGLDPQFLVYDDECATLPSGEQVAAGTIDDLKEGPPGFFYYDVGAVTCTDEAGDATDGKAVIRGKARIYPPQSFASGDRPASWQNAVDEVDNVVVAGGSWSGLFNSACDNTQTTAVSVVRFGSFAPSANHTRGNPQTDDIVMIYSFNTNGSVSWSGWYRITETEPVSDECIHLCADMNPAHIIRECLTDKEWGMGYSAADIDDVSFTAAADTLYAEQMGISILWQRENTIEAFVQDIVRHIDAALYVDRRTGKFVLKLIRDDYNPASLITLGPNEIERVENYKRPAFGDLVNSVTVIYDECDDGKRLAVTNDEG